MNNRLSILALTMILGGCISDNQPDNPSHTIVVEATASAPSHDDSSRAALIPNGSSGRYVGWEGSETFAITEVVDNVINPDNSSVESYDATPLGGGRSLSFKFALRESAGERFDYYALHPAGCGTIIQTQGALRASLTIPSEQVQSATSSPDSNAILLCAADKGHDSQESGIALNFRHVAAYAHITVENLDGNDGLHIRKVLFDAGGTPLAGEAEYDIAGGTLQMLGGEREVSADVEAFADECQAAGIPLEVWLALAPAESVSEFTLTVVAESEGRTLRYVKHVTVPDGREITFTAGRSASFTVNMAGIKGEALPEWLQPDKSGALFVLGSNGLQADGGEAPEGSEVTLEFDGSGPLGSINKGTIHTLRLEGYEGRTITNIYLLGSSDGDTAIAGSYETGSGTNIFTPPTISDGVHGYHPLNTGHIEVGDTIVFSLRNTSNTSTFRLEGLVIVLEK